MSQVEKRVEEDGDKVKHIIMGLVAGIIISVVSLEYYGYLRHSKEADSAMIEDFKLLTLKPGYDVKTSSKPSGKTAFCSGGSLLIKHLVYRAFLLIKKVVLLNAITSKCKIALRNDSQQDP